MWKTIFLLGVVFSVGAALTIFVYPQFSIINEIQNIPAHLQNIQTWISQQSIQVLASIGGAIGGLVTSTGLAWSRFRGMKEQVTQTQEQLYNTQTAATQEFQKLNDTIKAKETTITSQTDQIESLKTQLANAPNQEEIERLEKQITSLTNERNEAERILNAVRNPTVEQRKKELEQLGYTVIKRVDA